MCACLHFPVDDVFYVQELQAYLKQIITCAAFIYRYDCWMEVINLGACCDEREQKQEIF